MGSMFGGGSKAGAMQDEAARREAEASKQQTDLMAKQDAEKDQLKAEQDATTKQLEDRRRRVASGLIGRRSLFSNDETGFMPPSSTLGAS